MKTHKLTIGKFNHFLFENTFPYPWNLSLFIIKDQPQPPLLLFCLEQLMLMYTHETHVNTPLRTVEMD